MKARFTVLLAAIGGLAAGALAQERVEPFPAAKGNPDAEATVVVFNEQDTDAFGLARYYMQQRGIPEDHLIGLRTSLAEEISREDYDRTVAEPIRRAFIKNFWWKLRAADNPLGAIDATKIRYLALIRGLPVKIAGAADYPGDKPQRDSPVGGRNEAAVDSELAGLGMANRVISGALNNPYYRSFTPITGFAKPDLLIVCRLDGPSVDTVRRMIADGLAAEREGLTGLAYVDARGLAEGPYKEGDDWLASVATTARRRGTPVIYDTGPDLFPAAYPMQHAAFYYGWYAGDVFGPFAQPGFKFARGAIAVHIHSFSASTVRDPQKAWVAPLLYAGAAATLGNVYEPYLTLTAHLDVFHDRLCAGFTFGEAAYMSQRALSWMGTCVGDPLYRPYAGAAVGDLKPHDGEWAAYREGVEKWFGKGPSAGEEALKESARKLRSGVIYEGLGLLELTRNSPAEAIAAFQQARQLYRDPADAARAGIHEIFQLRNTKRDAAALALARKLIAANPRAPFVPMLQMFLPAPPAPGAAPAAAR